MTNVACRKYVVKILDANGYFSHTRANSLQNAARINYATLIHEPQLIPTLTEIVTTVPRRKTSTTIRLQVMGKMLTFYSQSGLRQSYIPTEEEQKMHPIEQNQTLTRSYSEELLEELSGPLNDEPLFFPEDIFIPKGTIQRHPEQIPYH